MRLVQKLSLAFMVGTAVILATNGYLRVRREVALLEADRVGDHVLIGRTLGAAIGAVWRSGGEEQAMDLIDVANVREGRVHVRWVWLHGDHGAQDLHAPASQIADLAPGETITRIAPDARGEDHRYTYETLRIEQGAGALELSEPLDVERASSQRIVVDTVRTTLILAMVTTLLSYILGSFFVGRPVRALVEKARRIGRGDFSEPVFLRSRDELAELAKEMNATSAALLAANERVARETSARIATLEQLRHADRLSTVGKLASGVAHELGTPLNVVAARAEMIRNGDATPDQAQEYAAVIGSAVSKMTRIIRQLLEFARRRGPRREPGDVAAVANRSLELLRPIAERQRVSFAVDAPGGPYEASVDGAQLEQALTNLVVNAIQAMPDGGAVRVSVRRERALPPAGHSGHEGDWIAVRVRDDGQGIAPEVLPHVFEPFFTTKDLGSGTGLGLSVAYGIVSDHGGWITVESEAGKGSVFSVFLPLEPA